MQSNIKELFHNFTVGVDFFFIISGFLIVFLLLVEKEKTKSISLIKFFIRRILRIFPLYILIVAIAYILYNESNPEIRFDKYAYFWANFWMIEMNRWTINVLNPLWSICIEEHFYLVVPFILLFLSSKQIRFVLIGIMIGSIAFRIYISFHVEIYWKTLYLHTLSRCDLLALGGLIAWYYKRKPIQVNMSGRNLMLATIFLIILACFIDFVGYSGLLNVAFKKYVYVLPMCIIFFGLVFNTSKDKSITFLRENFFINYLGKISYGLYMYHALISDGMSFFPKINNSLLLKPTIVVILTILVSTISYEFFEKQILKLKKPFEVIVWRSS